MRVLLVDATQILYASAFVTASRFKSETPMFGAETVVRFMGSIRSLVDRFAPSAVFVVWDGGRSARRQELYPEYKAQRVPLAENLSRSKWKDIAICSELCRDLRCRVLALPGKEADDVLGNLALHFKDPWIVSNDDDFLQLVEKGVSIFQISKDRVVTMMNFPAVWGFHASQFKLYKAILGDESDNISGVSNVGPKTILKILAEDSAITDIVTLAVALSKRERNFREDKLLASFPVVVRNLKLIDIEQEIFSPEDQAKIAKSLQSETQLNVVNVEDKMVSMGFKLNETFLFSMWCSPFARLA